MLKPFRPLQSRFARLMTCVLVVASLLGNGLALAQTPPISARKDCCAEMMGHTTHTAGCDEAGMPCPAPNAGCDDQCLLRCQSAVVPPMIVLASPASDLAQAALPPLFATTRRLVDSGPALRPPISV